jgi:hypothetical protein
VIMGAVASLAASGVAGAAVLEPIRGAVRVNHGDGYLAVHGVTNVNPGDQIMVAPKGRARLVYPDGCEVGVKAGSVMVIGAKSSCARQASADLHEGRQIGQGSTGQGSPADSPIPMEGALVVAGALAAVGGGITAGVANAHAGQPFILPPAEPASP